jgi:hypothetical protein
MKNVSKNTKTHQVGNSKLGAALKNSAELPRAIVVPKKLEESFHSERK